MSDDELDLITLADVERLLDRRFRRTGGYVLVFCQDDPASKTGEATHVELVSGGTNAITLLGLLEWAQSRQRAQVISRWVAPRDGD